MTGLDYLRARYYDSQVGTFLTEDSYSGELTDPLSQNLYTYVQNNPVNYTDPSGHFLKGVVKGIRKVATNIARSITNVARTVVNRVTRQVVQVVNRVIPTYPRPSGLGGYVASRVQQVLSPLQRAQASGQSTYNWSKSRLKEAANIHRNWTNALEKTIRHLCDPKRMKGRDTSAKQPKVSDSFKKDVNKLSYDELKKKYKGLISSQNSYQGTGYGYVVRSPKQLLEDQFVMKRYRELKREADAKQAAHMAELNKYYYLNLYKHILETGRRPDGTPATDLEKKIAPYVWLIEPVQIGASIYAGHQYSKHNSSIPTGNGMKWRRSGQGSNSNGTGRVYGPQPQTEPLQPLKPYGPQQYSGPLQPLTTLDKLSPRQISNMDIYNIENALPRGWNIHKNNGFVHIYDNVNPKPIIRIDPPDAKTNYPHMHFYDGNQNSLNIDGKIVDYRSPEAHIPWKNGQ